MNLKNNPVSEGKRKEPQQQKAANQSTRATYTVLSPNMLP